MSFKWVAAGNGEVPDNAVRGGQEQGQTLWVARAWYKDNLVPGRVKSADKCCYIPYGNAEHTVYNYEVLVAEHDAVEWIASSGGQVVKDAVEAGHESGEKLYIGRCGGRDGYILPGKVNLSQGVCSVSYATEETAFKTYEILVARG